jgi:hypothetical protein
MDNLDELIKERGERTGANPSMRSSGNTVPN